MNRIASLLTASVVLVAGAGASTAPAPPTLEFRDHRPDGRQLFERETFGGNGRTCRTCHSGETGTVSPHDAQKRLHKDPDDPLFLHDGSDDGLGHGVTRMLRNATIRMNIALAPNVRLAADPAATSMVVVRGIPTTLNTPALDPVLMLDGRESSLENQATNAIHDHAQAVAFPTGAEIRALVAFERTREFFSSHAVKRFAEGGRPPTCRRGARRRRSADAAFSRTSWSSMTSGMACVRRAIPVRCSIRRISPRRSSSASRSARGSRTS